MAKTITLRLDDDMYYVFRKAAEGDRRTISNLIGFAALRYVLDENTVDDTEMREILRDLGVGDEHYGVKVYRAPIILIAREQVGNEMSANVAALGVLNGIFDLVSDTAIEETLVNNFKGDVLEANLKAYKLGRAAGEAVK